MIDAGNPIIWSNRVKFISENYKYYEDGSVQTVQVEGFWAAGAGVGLNVDSVRNPVQTN